MDRSNFILTCIFIILIIQLMMTVTSDRRVHGIEKTLHALLAPMDQAALPEWEEQP